VHRIVGVGRLGAAPLSALVLRSALDVLLRAAGVLEELDEEVVVVALLKALQKFAFAKSRLIDWFMNFDNTKTDNASGFHFGLLTSQIATVK
jgi:hypothetical protein